MTSRTASGLLRSVLALPLALGAAALLADDAASDTTALKSQLESARESRDWVGVGAVARQILAHDAKNWEAERGLAQSLFHAEQYPEAVDAYKKALELVSGVPRLMSGTIQKPIGRNVRHRHKMAVVEEGKGGRASWTDWQVVEHYGDLAALLSCTLHTGRTHQIRVHLASLGHPLLGDSAYGWKANSRMRKEPGRVMLHSARICLTHPKSGKTLDLKAPLPADFKAQIKALKSG